MKIFRAGGSFSTPMIALSRFMPIENFDNRRLLQRSSLFSDSPWPHIILEPTRTIVARICVTRAPGQITDQVGLRDDSRLRRPQSRNSAQKEARLAIRHHAHRRDRSQTAGLGWRRWADHALPRSCLLIQEPANGLQCTKKAIRRG